MKLKAVFERKEARFEPMDCEISKVVELPREQYNLFASRLLADHEFLIELRDEMGITEDGVRHCLLVLPEGGDDGILVDAQGSSYARYSSFLPNARQQIILGQYQSLTDFAKEMYQYAESATQKILKGQSEGCYYLDASDIPELFDNPMLNYWLLGQMLSERPEFNTVQTLNKEILVEIAHEYQKTYVDKGQYRELSTDEVDIMLAKHMLFLRDAGGERADFSGCLLKDMGLSHAVFNNAIIGNAVFVQCDLSEADMNFASAQGAKFIECDMSHVYGDEADFSYAQFTGCNLNHALTTHANYTGADFNSCNVESMLLQGCCLAMTGWNGTDQSKAKTQGAVYSVEEYADEPQANEIRME